MRVLADFLRPRVVKIVLPPAVGQQSGEAVGSGFLVSRNGHILTCWHCVARFSIDQNGFLQYEYPSNIVVRWNNTEHRATITHRPSTDRPYTTDFAILKIDVRDTPFLSLGSYSDARQGDQVCFMGYPFASSELYFGAGHIAAMHQRRSDQNRMVQYDVMELDASINKGNSGGPLLHLPTRKVIGIIAMRLGTITPTLEVLRNYLGLWPGGSGILETGITELIYMAEQFTNVGLGTAVSIDYARSELDALRVSLEE